MAMFTLAASDALLVDHIAGSPDDYRAGLPLDYDAASGVLSGSLLANGTALEQGNLVATFDGDPNTTGLLPTLRLQLAGNSLPSAGESNFTLGWTLTAGVDGNRVIGEKQVTLSGLSVHVGAAANGEVLLYANPQTIKIYAYRSSSASALTKSVTFSPSDVLGKVVVEDGKVFLDFNFMAVVSKLDTMATLMKSFGYTPESLLSTGNYHLGITGLPLAGSDGTVSALSLIVPIAASANQAPQINGSVSDIRLTEDTPQTVALPAVDDPDLAAGETIVWEASSSDSRVAANIQDGKLTLTPDLNYNTTTPIVVTLKASDPALAWNTTSFAVTAVAAVNDPGVVSITGTAKQGETLSATVTDVDGIPATGVGYQWQAGGVDIVGANKASLLLTQAQVGKAISVTVLYQDLQGTGESVVSVPTAAVANVNDAPTGSVTILGTPTYDETLSVSSTLADVDGLGTLTYQWLADGSPILGATAPTLMLGQEQVGRSIGVRVSYRDGGGKEESIDSTVTAAVTRVNFAPSGTVTIDGTPTQGETLTASHTIADRDGLGTISWQWLADGEAIRDATGQSLVLTQAQVGKAISVMVSYTDGGNTAESVSSALTSAVSNVNDLPTGAVTIDGRAEQGQTLTAISTLDDPDGMQTIAWEWYAGAEAIDRATGETLTLTQDEVDKEISVKATYTDGGNTVESVSYTVTSVVSNVNDAPTGTLTISGTARQGETLTATSGLDDLDGMGTISWQWLADGVAIVEANGEKLTLSKAQVGKAISVRASYTDAEGTVESVLSSATLAVASSTSKTTAVSLATSGNDLLIGKAEKDVLYGEGGNDTIAGLEGDDSLYGGAGNDFLDGGAGNDALHGDVGNDTYVIDSTNDLVREKPKAGTDLVKVADISAGATYVLPENVENAILINPVAYNLTGNGLANLLTGNDFANEIDGGDDLLADTLVGGGGDDTYVVRLSAAGSLQDKISETSKTDSGDTLRLEGELKASKIVALTLSGSLANLEHLDASRITWSDSAPNSPASRKLNLTGNAAANRLTGDDADNVLSGLAGADTLRGGAGNDTYVVDDLGDVVQEAGLATDIDTVLSSISFSLANAADDNELADVENLTLTGKGKIDGTGNALANKLTGNAAANALAGGLGEDTLIGGAGNDTLDGGEGLDSLEGGAGDDTYIVDLTAEGELEDIIVEAVRGGMDTLRLRGSTPSNAVTFGLTGMLANLEHLDASATGSIQVDLTGNAAANVLTGNNAANALDGGAGNDTLIGGGNGDKLLGGDGNDSLDGGEGDDTLVGGFGNDIYVIDSQGDEVHEEDKQGVDLVELALAGGTYVLADYVENATLKDGVACHLTGNAEANVLRGNAVANHLAGGDGNDILIGGAGNDTLDGGAGVDALTGGDGDDTYIVQLTAKGALEDKITETSATDTGDTLQVWGSLTTQTVSLALSGSLAKIEHLDASRVTWSESAPGTSASRKLNLTGNVAANELTGSAGDNVISGLAGADTLDGGAGNDTLNGGAGDDVLTGGEGSDVFLFNAALSGKSGSNVDHIQEFVSDTDRIFLDDAVFKFVGKGTSAGAALSEDRFCLGSKANDAADRIIYDQTNGNLYYDPTGLVNGATDQVLFAVIVNKVGLSQDDFFIV